MNKKAMEKLFNLAYTDSMTGVKNRTAFDELREQLNKHQNRLEKVCVISVIYEDYDMVSRVFGNSSADDAMRAIAQGIVEMLGEKADIYRISKNEFMCVSHKNLFVDIVKVSDAMRRIREEKTYPFDPIVSCSKFDKKMHKNFDEFIISCDEYATR